MATRNHAPKIVVGVDGSDASVEALRQAQRLAGPLGAEIEASGCWEYPQMYDGYDGGHRGIRGTGRGNPSGSGDLSLRTSYARKCPDPPCP
jgi:nucleotide-binding universal stress UspA family protein